MQLSYLNLGTLALTYAKEKYEASTRSQETITVQTLFNSSILRIW